jgi:hypothetical protein
VKNLSLAKSVLLSPRPRRIDPRTPCAVAAGVSTHGLDRLMRPTMVGSSRGRQHAGLKGSAQSVCGLGKGREAGPPAAGVGNGSWRTTRPTSEGRADDPSSAGLEGGRTVPWAASSSRITSVTRNSEKLPQIQGGQQMGFCSEKSAGLLESAGSHSLSHHQAALSSGAPQQAAAKDEPPTTLPARKVSSLCPQC